ncbi:MAG: serine/threonine protein kinase, partial [Myxococcales bacterium]|nr:serine/threonine protein kinase [Myxococcales bacterium]
MARVTEVATGGVYALKRMHPALVADSVARERMLREAMLGMRGIDGVVRVIDVLDGDGTLSLLMQYVCGGSLARRLMGGALPWRDATRMAVQVAHTLARLHALKVIHRDVKPDNILLDPSGRPLVADLGIAHFKNAIRLTHGGGPATLEYCPPEQAAGRLHSFGPPTDIYALAATLYDMVCGVPPFDTLPGPKRDTHECIQAILTQDPTPPRRICRELPVAVEAVILKALSKDPGARHQTAKDFAADLQAAAGMRESLGSMVAVGVVASMLAVALSVGAAAGLAQSAVTPA